MTYPGPYGTPAFGVDIPSARRPRPVTVTIAASALFLIALLGLVSAIASFAEAGPASDRVVTGGDDADAVAVALVIYGVIALVTAVYYVIAGIFTLRGSRGIRIATWVVAGLTVLCLGCNGLGNGVIASGVNTSTLGDDNNESLVVDSLSHAYTVTTATLEIITCLVAIVAIILLAVPASNTYFRKIDPMAAMYAAYGYPGYAPGYPAGGYGYAAPPPAPWQGAPAAPEPAPWQSPPAAPEPAPWQAEPARNPLQPPASASPSDAAWAGPPPSAAPEPQDTPPPAPPAANQGSPTDPAASDAPHLPTNKPRPTDPDGPSDSIV